MCYIKNKYTSYQTIDTKTSHWNEKQNNSTIFFHIKRVCIHVIMATSINYFAITPVNNKGQTFFANLPICYYLLTFKRRYCFSDFFRKNYT